MGNFDSRSDMSDFSGSLSDVSLRNITSNEECSPSVDAFTGNPESCDIEVIEKRMLKVPQSKWAKDRVQKCTVKYLSSEK